VPVEGTSPRPAGDALVGAVLAGRVRIIRLLARGGMGRVYYGEQTGLGRPCAVKVLDPRLVAAGAGDFARRFLLEASVASKISHPNVVTVFDYGETADHQCYIAMEYLDGRSLADELKKGPIAAERAIHVTRQVCRALREAHALGVVHRDVKPGNVLLVKRDEDDDFVKVLDFGLVGEANDGDDDAPIMGSPKYMAPEQVQGKASDARTDVYAVGAMLYAMLAGKPPFERATDLATMMAQVSDEPPPLAGTGAPPPLEGVVLKCLSKNPDQRFRSMDDLLAALRPLADGKSADEPVGSPGAATPTGPSLSPSRASRRAGRGTLSPLTLAAGFFVVVAGVMGASELHRRASLTAPTTSPAPPTAVDLPQPTGAFAAPVVSATMHLETVPPGAKVKEEGETLCEATPCDVAYKGEAAGPSVEHLLVFMKAGYKLERKIATVDASPLRVKLTRAQ
jgi:serine/threonine-protein kinase